MTKDELDKHIMELELLEDEINKLTSIFHPLLNTQAREKLNYIRVMSQDERLRLELERQNLLWDKEASAIKKRLDNVFATARHLGVTA